MSREILRIATRSSPLAIWQAEYVQQRLESLHEGLRVELVPVNSVRYFLADQKYVTVCFSEGEVLIDETLKELEAEFGDQFVRIHRNALVALNFIEGMEMATAGHHQVRLRGVDERLTVSRRHVAGLRRVLQNL